MSKNPVVKARGFTLIELLVVLAIIMVVTVIALPRISTAIASYRLRNAMAQMSAMLQQQRSSAVRDNSTISAIRVVQSNRTVLFADINGNGQLDPTEPQIMLPAGMLITGTLHPGDVTTGTPTSILFVNNPPIFATFNGRGLPCVVQASGLCASLDSATGKQVAFAFYIRNTGGMFQGPGWGAILITPAGRVQNWIWTGTRYSQL